MPTPLLRTKLYIPPIRPELVPRPSLIERLNAGFNCKLTLVSAPAGFGKTTLISEWICGSDREVAWVSLDEGDNDPAQFLTYLIAALQQVNGSIGQTVRQVLQSPSFANATPPPTQSLVTPLINDITAAGTALILVLDDYHLINATAVHQAVQFLLEHQPPTMHLVISTRTDPPLPLPRLRAQGQVAIFRERDLRFATDEIAAFLNQTIGLPLSPKIVKDLESRTEGWIAGLQMAALALQEDRDATRAEAFIAGLKGDDRYITDYLVTEVLQRQPEAVRDFLRQTAILDRLTAPLCEAVTGRQDSQVMIERLVEANLFLIPLDHRREWYRYHRLFAGVLRTTLGQEEQKPLHQRAMRWYETYGFASQAIRHALALALVSGDWDDAGRLIRLAADETIHSGGLITVRNWLDALPDAYLRANAELATYNGWVSALTGELALAEEYANVAKTHLRRARPEPGRSTGQQVTDSCLGKLLTLRSFIAVFGHQDYEEALELAADALQVLNEDQAHWRVIALWAMAESQERTVSIAEAIATLREARQIGRALDKQVFAITITIDLFLATALHLHGQRREAVTVCEEAIARWTDLTGRVSPVAGPLLSRLGTLHYEANQLELARKYLDQGLALSEEFSLETSILFSHSFAAPTLYAQGETDAALAALRKAYHLAIQTGLTDTDWCLAWEANIHLQQGDLASTLSWATDAGLSPDAPLEYLHLESHLVYGRLLLAQGRLSDARRWLVRLERFLKERGLYRWLITVHILQALTAERSGDHPAACELVSRALESAASEDYLRAFLDEDEQVIALLSQVRHVAPAFVDQLLDYAPDARGPIPQPLTEPLSERELEVLRLIAAGLSNREIAQRLFIAHGTVKRHINNMYGKLQVKRRTEAVARGQELGLL